MQYIILSLFAYNTQFLHARLWWLELLVDAREELLYNYVCEHNGVYLEQRVATLVIHGSGNIFCS